MVGAEPEAGGIEAVQGTDAASQGAALQAQEFLLGKALPAQPFCLGKDRVPDLILLKL